jgi:Histidine kinase-, DNA gyrase B-, and HSP90-like ATPase
VIQAEVSQDSQASDAECRCASRSIESLDLDNWSACMRELSLHILDVVQNSLEAGATLVELTIDEDLPADRLSIIVKDNGRGMSETQLARVFDPFFTTRSTRHVGLGVPLFKAAAERCNGELTMTSQLGIGTILKATFQHSHIDRAPLGDITGTLMAVILGNQTCDIHYTHRLIKKDGGKQEFELDTAGIKAELGDVSLAHPSVRKWLQNFIAEGERDLG